MGKETRNYILYDLETSGVDYEDGQEIVQIGALAISPYEYNIIPNSEFNITLKPQTPDKASKEAIAVIGEDLWEEAKANGLHPKVGLQHFVQYINKYNPHGKYWSAPVLLGFNTNGFDNDFLKYYLRHYKICKKRDDFPWCYYTIDVATQMIDLFGRDNMAKRKLDSYCELFGISRSSEEHDALEDCYLTHAIFKRYMIMMDRVRSQLTINNN